MAIKDLADGWWMGDEGGNDQSLPCQRTTSEEQNLVHMIFHITHNLNEAQHNQLFQIEQAHCYK
jgi:hypothetical protein